MLAGGERGPSGVPIAAKPVAEAPGDKCPLKRHQDGGVAVFIESAFVSFRARKLFLQACKVSTDRPKDVWSLVFVSKIIYGFVGS